MVPRRMKIANATIHGFRSSFRDWLAGVPRYRGVAKLRLTSHDPDQNHHAGSYNAYWSVLRSRCREGAKLVRALLMRTIGRSRNGVRMLAATLVPGRYSSGHCGKLCRWSHLISSAKGQPNCGQFKSVSWYAICQEYQDSGTPYNWACLTLFLC